MPSPLHQNSSTGATMDESNRYEVPEPRKEWIVGRKAEAARTGDWNMSQMHFAHLGKITEEMAFVAHKETISAELVRSEINKDESRVPVWVPDSITVS